MCRCHQSGILEQLAEGHLAVEYGGFCPQAGEGAAQRTAKPLKVLR
jgi:hypothetical protein